MSGNLPATRVATSATYADDFVDEKPVEKPDSELPASVFNAMKSDLAYCTRMVPLLKIRIANNGTASVSAVTGPEGVIVGDVTVNRTGAGVVTIDWSGTGVTATDAIGGSARHAANFGIVGTHALSASGVTATVTGGGGPFDCDFTLWVY